MGSLTKQKGLKLLPKGLTYNYDQVMHVSFEPYHSSIMISIGLTIIISIKLSLYFPKVQVCTQLLCT